MKKSKSQKSASEKKPAVKKNSQDEFSDRPDAAEEFLIVGIGASAGGIQALKEFFENVPADSGMAYVVILHLSPDHDSQLAEVLQMVASIPVAKVTERVKVEPNRVYVVPPNQHLGMEDGHIVVAPNVSVAERRAPVDIFFRTLADSHYARAVAVILSGTGANGSMGLKRVKERGGAAFVQNPREAEFSEMPRNAIATDLIDQILNVADIPARIVAYKNSIGAVEIPVEPQARPDDHQQALREIFTQIRHRTGHDFSNYKRPTVLRRIERRINVFNLPDITSYAAFVRENADEAKALLKDLLISVTNFFRDKDAFHHLEAEILPKIFQDKQADDQVRIWVCGCATGEEAYSLAMLCAERTMGAVEAPTVQIFATDIDEQAIQTAREGFYTLNDAADVSPERMQRFFTKDTGGYRIRRELREMILFANHNVIKDPPFSRLDLTTCRNMLIYLNHTAQERVMETFHFALQPGGFLFLGNSESVDGAGDLYATVSKENRIYQSRPAMARFSYPVPETSRRRFGSKTFTAARNALPLLQPPPPPAAADALADSDSEQAAPPAQRRVSVGDLHRRLLEQYAPPSIVVNEEYDIVHSSENAGRFLQFAGGEPTKNLLKLIRPELRLELRAALYQAVQKQTNVEVKNLKIRVDEREETINLYARPVLLNDELGMMNDELKEKQSENPNSSFIVPSSSSNLARGFVLVVFETAQARDGEKGETDYAPHESVTRQLEVELLRTKSQLRQTVEQFEIQAEELKASNEEFQAINEELRLATEELETSKEELQSVNEELVTVNQELKIKIEEITLANNDFQNLINSTDIATIFLDRKFRVHTFTPAATRLFNLLPTDVDRPITDITHRLEDARLLDVAQTVPKTLQTIERETRSTDGRIYQMRALPYRTREDRINGVVLTFFDITERKQAEEASSFLAAIVESADEAMLTVNFEGIITSWNSAAERLYGYAAPDAVGKPLTMLTLPEDLREVLVNMERIKFGETIETYETVRVHQSGQPLEFEILLSPVKNARGKIIGVSTIARNITERHQAEIALRESEERMRIAIEAGGLGTWEWDLRRNVVFWNERHFLLFGMEPGENPLKPEMFFKHVHPDDRERINQLLKKAIAENTVFEAEFRAVTESGEERWMGGYGRVVEHLNGEPTRMGGVMFDTTERKRAEILWRENETRFRAVVEQATVGVSELDLAGNNTLVNDKFCQMLGYAEAELLQMNLCDFTHPEDLPTCLSLFKRAIENAESSVNEKRLIRKDGSILWINDSISPITDASGKTTSVAAVAIDITERKQAEEALRKSEERLRLLVESASDYAIFTTTLDNRINSWNAGAQKVFGWTEDEAVGQSAVIIFTPEDIEKREPEKEIETAIKNGRAPDERFHLRKDGSRFYASGVMSLLRDANGDVQGFAKIARDMTEQIVAEKALREKELLQKLVVAQEDERKRIALDIHDQIGQQMTSLRLKLESLRKMCDAPQVCDEIDQTEKIAEQLDSEIDFIAWELRPASLDDLGLRVTLGNYVTEWSRHTGIKTEFHSTGLAKTRLAFEAETNLYRITQEALNNVYKHAKPQNVSVLLEKRGDAVSLIIEDDGVGFNPRDKKNRAKGMGLIGMSERAKLSGGELEIESKRGEGTTVFVRVPVKKSTAK